MSIDEAKLTFSQESEELLQQMEDALLMMEDAPDDEEHLNSVFRAMHTIKGAAGIFGFDYIVEFTHPVETELDRVRRDERSIDGELIATLLDCKDHTAALVTNVMESEENTLPDELKQIGDALLDKLIGEQAAVDEEPAATTSQAIAETKPAIEIEGKDRIQPSDNWLISLDFKQDALRNGLDPLSFLRYLGTLGSIVNILTLTDDMVNGVLMDAESCYLGFRIIFNSDADKKTIEGVFEFAQDDCDIRILAPHSRRESYLELLDEMSGENVCQLGEMLVEIGALTENELANGLKEQSQAEGDGSRKPLGEILIERKVVEREVVDKALKSQQQARNKAATESQYIRVDSGKLGQLINLVGELVISSAAMNVMAKRYDIGEVEDVVSTVDHLVQEIRDNALQLRMVQIGETFSRFRRIARDVSRDLGKEIELKITGGESELDKTVVEKVSDPLTHLVRNSLDHGIESPEQREVAGKPRQGTVHLNAYHDSGHIVIQIVDDGAGLDPERILAKAEHLGLVQPGQELTRQEIFRLIFAAGLSTKQEADNLSGRGVGMDVVRRNIESLRGTIEIDSELGKGTTVTLNLPLTLAIIDGFLVGAQDEVYIIPLSMVEECVEMNSGEWELDHRRQYVNLHGEVLPYMRLGDFFGTPRISSDSNEQRESLVVVRFGRTKAGFVVDQLFGEQQTVIKPIGKVFQNLKGISGATVLGSGDIALILDVQGLVSMMHVQQSDQARLTTQSQLLHSGYKTGR